MPLNSISPIDGRYEKYTKALAPFFSESASMKYKILVECEYLIALAETSGIGIQKLNDKEKTLIRKLYENFSIKDAELISDFELKGYKNIPATNHDFKAIEYWIKEKLGGTSLKDILEFVHFGLTSEDTSNIAYALMIGESVKRVYFPALKDIVKKIEKLTKENENVPMLARTHGQSASPTTFGKEFKVFSERLKRQLSQLENHKLEAKLNGATGNYNALFIAYPKIDWIKFSASLVSKIGKLRGIPLEVNLY